MKDDQSRRAAKLADVARLARVSTATVSRTLTVPHKVKPATAARINQVIESLGYVAHGAARALASRRSRTVGAVLPTLDNAIFAKTVQALQHALDAAGYMLLVAGVGHDEQTEARLTRALIEHGVDALVLIGTPHHECVLAMLEAHQVPFVSAWALDDGQLLPRVGFDNRAAGVRMARHLLELGHREFAMISGFTGGNERAGARLGGVRDTLAEYGLTLAPHRLVEKPYSLHAGRDGLRELMSRSERPTAVICGNDILAIGAMDACRELGIDVPGDVSITGFYDLEIAAVVTPGLTTIRFPAAEMGAIVAAKLLAQLAGDRVERRTELPVELVARESSSPPRR